MSVAIYRGGTIGIAVAAGIRPQTTATSRMLDWGWGIELPRRSITNFLLDDSQRSWVELLASVARYAEIIVPRLIFRHPDASPRR